MDKLDFLNGQEPEPTDAPTPEAVTEPEGPARGPDGKFAAKEPEQAAPPQEPEQPAPEPALAALEPQPQAPQPPAERMVPLSALQDLRAEIKALRSPPPAPPPPPDRYDDPDGYDAYQRAEIDNRLLTHTLNTSERFARKEHGPEVLEAAKAWALEKFQNDPLYHQRVLADPDPYELAVQDYKREQLFTQIQGSDLDAFLAWKAASSGQAPPISQAAPAAPPQSPTPPRSQAAAPSAGGSKPGVQPAYPGAAYGTIFG